LTNRLSPLGDLRALLSAVSLIRRLRPDLVATHSSKAGLVGRVAARLTRVPSVFTAHGWAFAPGVPAIRRAIAAQAERRAAALCARVITVNESDRTLALRLRIAPPNKLKTIPYGIPDTPARAEPATSGTTTFVMVARFEPQKDHLALLRALGMVRGDWRAILVGDGPTRQEVQVEAGKAGLADRVQFTGARDDVAEILAGAHVFVLSSRWEGLPLTVLEAMRAGLPVVASDVGGVGEAVGTNQTGFLVPLGDHGQLAEPLTALCANPDLRARLGRQGRRVYEARFQLDRMVAETAALYDDVLRERTALPPSSSTQEAAAKTRDLT